MIPPGSILEDEKVIGTLETLKSEAAEIKRKVEETDVVMEEVENVTKIYRPLSGKKCRTITFTFTIEVTIRTSGGKCSQLSLFYYSKLNNLPFQCDVRVYSLPWKPSTKYTISTNTVYR